MSEEQLTPEEAQAFEAMEQDTGEGIPDEPVEPKEPEAKEPEKASDDTPEKDKEPEFKSSRSEPEKPPEGFVPHQAMHAERLKRQELERRLAEIEAKEKEAEAEQAPQYVDPLDDPEGFRRYDEWRTAQVNKRLEEQQSAFQRAQQERIAYLDVQKSEAEFQAKTPDYPKAVEHLYNHRARELQSMGYPPEEAQSQIVRDVHAIYEAAKQIGMNPAELAYHRAMSIGYKRVEVKPETNEAEKVQALAKAQDAASGIGTTGAPQEGQLTIEQLSKMSEAELAKVPEEQFKKVMGG